MILSLICYANFKINLLTIAIFPKVSFLTFAFASIFVENVIWFTLFCHVAFYKETIYVYLISYLIIIIKVEIQLLYVYLECC